MTSDDGTDRAASVVPVFEAADDAATTAASETANEGTTSAAADDDGDGAGSGGTDEGIPLDIVGHGEREAPSNADDGSPSDEDGFDGSSGDRGKPGAAAVDIAGDGEEDIDPDDGTREGEDEVEPVEVLVGLADDGEIDPWDIDVVRVTDKFLNAMDEADLRTSGRALFYASVLIRMKSDAMLAPDEPEESEEPWQRGMDDEAPIEGMDPFASLESEMERRLERKRARGMPRTLDELVRDLRDAERDSWWKEGRTYDTSGSPEGFQRGTQELDYHAADDRRMAAEPTAEDVTGTTHTEDVDRIIEDVYDALNEQYDAGREEVLYREVASAGGSRVETYLGLLFLAHRGRVRLQQDEFFGDLWIQDPGASTGSEEALAD